MLNSIFKDAVERREETLQVLKGLKFEEIKEKAKEKWIEYAPIRKDVIIAGIDSSFNSTKFQGVEMWAAAAISIKSDGDILADIHDFGLGCKTEISTMASKMEIQACEESTDLVDLVLLDGSLYSQFMTRQTALTGLIVKTMKKRDNVIFISKTSNTRAQFERFNSLAGDIFYYNHATITSGFSELFKDLRFGKEKIITSTYVRMNESLPLVKVELLGDHTEDEIKEVMDKIYKSSVGGYPYALKLAHNKCKISGKDLAKLVSLYGMSAEIGSRDVLG